MDKVERITLAGAFGSHIDPAYAMALGLIPDCPLDKVVLGRQRRRNGRAHRASERGVSRREISEVVRRIEKVETAIEPGFQAHFVEAMAIPHASDAFPHLEERLGVTFKRAKAHEPRRRGGRRGTQASSPREKRIEVSSSRFPRIAGLGPSRA